MMSAFLSQFWVQRLGWALLHFLWQGTAIVILYAMLRKLLARALSAQGRYALACSALVAMAAAPPLTFLLIPNGGGSAASAVSAHAGWWTISVSGWQWLLPGVVALWLLGVMAFSLRLFGGWRFTARLRSISHPAPGEWQQTLERIAAQAGVSFSGTKQTVRLLVSSLVDVPTVIGWLRPVILVPVECLAGLPAGHITALLAHELAHIRRHDYLANILQSIAEAVLFYHPAVWWVSEQIRAERELCCDDVAVAVSGDALTYARALAELESRQSSRRTPVLAANGGSLVNRIRRLIEPAHAIANTLPGPGAAWAMTLLWLAGVGVATVHAARTPAPHVVNVNAVPVSALASHPVAALASQARDTLLYDPFLSAQLMQPQGRGGAQPVPVPVKVARVKRTTVPFNISGLGNVTPSSTVVVKSRVEGQLMSVNFQEGDMVKQDQVLFTIDPRPYQVLLAQAEGQLARDLAQLGDARAATQQQRTAQLEATVKADQAAADNARLQLVYSKVTAPLSGRIGFRMVDPGNMVHPDDPLLVITQVHPVAVRFTIPEDALQPILKKLRSGAKLAVEAWNRSNSVRLATGYLLTVDNEIDATTGTSKLKAIFSNDDEELFPNQFVNARVLVDTLRDQLAVPGGAVQHGQNGTFVFVVGKNSRAQSRAVSIGVETESNTQILSGLEEGEQVVVEGFDQLRNNAEVRIR